MLLSHQFILRKLPITQLDHKRSTSHSKTLTNPTLNPQTPHFSPLKSNPFIHTRCRAQNPAIPSVSDVGSPIKPSKPKVEEGTSHETNFWGAVSLIIGTAVGPGMLGLPSATIKAGPFPSTIAILLSWVYVVSSILLVAELSFAFMEKNGVGEVSFTSLATNTLGGKMGAFVSIVYASLSFSLLFACISGIGSIVIQWFPWMNSVLAHALIPCFVGMVISLFRFNVIDSVNRFFCFLMLISITALVSFGVSIGRANLVNSFGYASWSPSAILPSIPITVLTLGFHVITPFVCKIVGKSVFYARKAILFGGAVPLIMVLSWNLVVLGLARTTATISPQDPISLLLSVNSSALPAVQGFALAALATSLIGYAVSFPKQLTDTLELIWRNYNSIELESSLLGCKRNSGQVGCIVYSSPTNLGAPGKVSFIGSRRTADSGVVGPSADAGYGSLSIFVMPVVLGVPVLIASFFPSTFSKALDFSGVYANCFLFGILPPVMAWIHRSQKKSRSFTSEDVNLLPGGNITLLLLFVIAVILAIWH